MEPVLGKPIHLWTWMLQVSTSCSSINLNNVRRPFSKAGFILMWEPSVVTILAKVMSCLFDQVTVINGMPSSRIVRPEPIIGNLESASATWCLIQPLWIISNQISLIRPSAARVYWLYQWGWVSIKVCGGLCVMQIFHVLGMAVRTEWARLLQDICGVWYLCSPFPLKVRQQYPLGQSLFSSIRPCRGTRPTCLSHASMTKL